MTQSEKNSYNSENERQKEKKKHMRQPIACRFMLFFAGSCGIQPIFFLFSKVLFLNLLFRL